MFKKKSPRYYSNYVGIVEPSSYETSEGCNCELTKNSDPLVSILWSMFDNNIQSVMGIKKHLDGLNLMFHGKEEEEL